MAVRRQPYKSSCPPLSNSFVTNGFDVINLSLSLSLPEGEEPTSEPIVSLVIKTKLVQNNNRMSERQKHRPTDRQTDRQSERQIEDRKKA